ncbi:MAG: efflux RND transporter periplasmic adaptor subunit [Thermoanaerobaculum sp.]
MRRGVVWVVIAATLGAVFGRFFWEKVRGVEVEWEEVRQGRVVEAVYATARVDSDQRAVVRARVSAPLAALKVGPGEQVREGQVVAIQDPREFLLLLARQEKELAAAQSALAEAADAAGRAEQLFRQGLLPENQFVAARERATELSRRAEALAEALKLAREQVAWCTLKAPLAGTVASLFRRTGDLVQSGEEVLSIVDLRQAYLRASVDERDLGAIRADQEVRIVFDAYPNQVFQGKVWRVVPAVDRLTRSADVLVELPPERPPLQLDLTATVNIVTRVVENALLAPRSALQGSGERKQALRIGRNGRLEAATVRVGACDATRCQVLEGLAPGDKVATRPGGVAAGTKVRKP